MTDADVGKPVEITGGIPLKSMFGPQPIDWRKVAASLRVSGDQAERDLNIAPHGERAAIATVMATCRCLAAAIEDGLS